MIKLIVNISKKVPGPVDYSSVQASCSIEAECAGDPAAEARALYQQAEQAVNEQLEQQPSALPAINGNGHARARFGAAQGHSNGNGHRRAKTASAAQLNYLRTLLNAHPGEEDALLRDEGVTSIDQLESRACSLAIDRLKGVQR